MDFFHMRGEAFIFIFGFLVAIVLSIQSGLINFLESIKDRPKIDLTDPYKIAIIRGGVFEGIRIAIFSLVDRSLLEFKNGKIKTPENLSSSIATRPVERKILDHLRHETSIAEAIKNPKIVEAFSNTVRLLDSDYLCLGRKTMNLRLMVTLPCLAFITAIGIKKIMVAISTGHNNFGLLVIALIFSWITLFMNSNQSTTVNGRISVNGLRALLNDLFKRRESISPGGATNEATLAAAVFGLGILSSSKFPFLNALISDSKPRIRYQSAGNGDASFDISADNFLSSSCSSSSSGCGGGCSGCGGCGD